MTTKSKARRHNTQKHCNHERPTVCSPGAMDSKEIRCASEDNDVLDDDVCVDNEPITSFFQREASITYFKSNVVEDGAFYLTAKAVLNDGTKKNDLDVRDVVMFMSVAHLVATITRTQRELFAVVLSETTKCALRGDPNMSYIAKPSKIPKHLQTVKLAVPTTKEQIRWFIIEGKDA